MSSPPPEFAEGSAAHETVEALIVTDGGEPFIRLERAPPNPLRGVLTTIGGSRSAGGPRRSRC